MVETEARRVDLLARVVAIVTLIAAAAVTFLTHGAGAGTDFFHFWMMPRAARALPEKSIYDTDSHPAIRQFARKRVGEEESERLERLLERNSELYKTGLHPTGSPFLYAVFGYLQTGYFGTDYWAFQLMSTVVFLFGLRLLGSLVGLGWNASLVIGVAALLLFASFGIDFRVANTNRIQVAMFALAGWLMYRQQSWNIFAGGLVLGLWVMFKPNTVMVPLIFLGGCAIEQQWRAGAQIALGTALGVVAGWGIGVHALGDAGVWQAWIAYLSSVWAEPFDVESGNYTLVALLDGPARGVVSFVGALVLTLVIFGVYIWRVWRGRREQGAGEQRRLTAVKKRPISVILIGMASLGLVIPLVVSPVVWSHYYLLAFPALILMMPRHVRLVLSGRPVGKQVGFGGSGFAGSGTGSAVGWWLAAVCLSGLPVTIFSLQSGVWIAAMLQVGAVALIISALLANVGGVVGSAVDEHTLGEMASN